MRLEAKQRILHSGKVYEPGEFFDFDDADRAAVLIERGVAAKVKASNRPAKAVSVDDPKPKAAKKKAAEKKAAKKKATKKAAKK